MANAAPEVSTRQACFGCCCAASEWHWFRWTLAAQPAVGLLVYTLARLELL